MVEAAKEIERRMTATFPETKFDLGFDAPIANIIALHAAALSDPREMPGQRSNVQKFWDAQAEWSQATFGADSERDHIGPLKHLAKEAVEAQVRPPDWVEIADCLFLVFDAARRSGMHLDTLIKVAEQKLVVNKARKWNKPTGDIAFAEHVRDEAIEHVRASAPSGNAGSQPADSIDRDDDTKQVLDVMAREGMVSSEPADSGKPTARKWWVIDERSTELEREWLTQSEHLAYVNWLEAELLKERAK